MVASFALLDRLFSDLQISFPVPLGSLQECLLALELLLCVRFLPLFLSSKVATFPSQ